MERKILEASAGMYLTNGTVYGKKIYLADGMSETEFYEVTEEEYEKIIEEAQKEFEAQNI